MVGRRQYFIETIKVPTSSILCTNELHVYEIEMYKWRNAC